MDDAMVPAMGQDLLKHVAPPPDRTGHVGGIESLIDHCLQAVREHGAQARPDERTVARFHLAAATRHLPGNWNTLFAPLAEGVMSHR
ncbi:hypothetical protein ACFC1R_18305 [Kitasatospora sp. NPDC056138]|uniref:hypothetical protein n=1 Tax=Kitasatospora sp. NPDC056138 TaxID=3345724 RepID=UPI0035DBB445